MVPWISRSSGTVPAASWLALALHSALCSSFAAADPETQPRLPSVVFVAQRGDTLPEVGASAAADATKPALMPEQKRFRTNAIIIGGAVSVAAYGATTWWNEGFSGGFKTVREGWFGQGTPDGGADKLGHMQANYVGTRLLTRAFEWAGLDSSDSLRLAAISTFSVFAGAEVLDAFTPRYRFSYEDVVMNALGVGVALLMEKNPRLDALVDLRLQYKPSADPNKRGFDPFGDYSGQTYLLVGRASGVPALREIPAIRCLEVAVGYGTRGYEVGPDVIGDKSRYVYAGVSLNLSELLDRTVFSGQYRDGITHRATRGFLEVFQIPGTAALAKDKL